MRSRLVIAVSLITLAGCKSSESCSATVSCGGKSYQACTSGSSCRIVGSDGNSWTCASCGDCAEATMHAVAWCGGTGSNGVGDMAMSSFAQPPICADWLNCAAQYKPSQFPSLVSTYGPTGSCWQATAMLASSCAEACATALTAARNDPTAPSVCGGGTDMAWPLIGDLAAPPGSDLSQPSVVDMAQVYTAKTIAQMRSAGTGGAFELDHVVAIAVSPTGRKLFAQDAVGGDYSAIEVDCSATSTSHPCTVLSTVKTIAAGHAVTIRGAYYRSGTTGYEQLYLDSIVDEGAAASVPAAQSIAYAAVVRSATSRARWFQRVNVTLSDDLVMFDYTPPELARGGVQTVCPYQFGFGMVPKTGAPTLTAAQVCDPSCSTPTGCTTAATAQTASSASELLVGTDFYTTFTVSSDCRCLASYHDSCPTAAQSIPQAKGLAGMLTFDVPFMATSGYQYLAPTANADFPIQ